MLLSYGTLKARSLHRLGRQTKVAREFFRPGQGHRRAERPLMAVTARIGKTVRIFRPGPGRDCQQLLRRSPLGRPVST